MNASASFGDRKLAKALDALSSPVRLAILRALQEPRCLSDIGVGPGDDAPGHRLRGGILSRQTVKMHIDRLADAGIVVAKVPHPRGRTTHYVLDPDSLVAISEAVRDLAQQFTNQVPADLTAPLGESAAIAQAGAVAPAIP